ncbi:MAG: sigma-54-dependent transcriptional regulator, partial [Nannocystaceae bacterium]
MSASSPTPVILVVDDEASIVDAMERVLRKEQFEVLTAPDGRAALELIRQQPVHVVLTDLRMPGMTGEDLLKAVKSLAPEIEVVVMTAYGTIANAVDAMRYGAYDFVSKPLKRADVVSTIRKAVERRNLVVENKSLRAELEAVRRSSLVGNSQVLRSTIEIAEQAAASSASVLLMGESGTGKELLARMVHERSARADGPFIATNCAALPESILESELFGHEKGAFTGAVKERVGRFEQADGGTLFLDEIGELPLSVQVKLLRAIQEGEVEPVGGTTRKVDFRLVCATNRNLAEDVKAGKFREDLFYRINVVPL